MVLISILELFNDFLNKHFDALTMTDEAYRKIHFAVMAIESSAKKLNITGTEMAKRLRNQDLIHNRLFEQYEMLHTQSLDYVSDDIIEALLNREKNNTSNEK